MTTNKTYQYALKAEECKLFRDLRGLQKRSTDLLEVPNQLKSHTFDISVHAGGRHLGRVDINAGRGLEIVQDFACVGVDSLRNLLKDYNKQNGETSGDQIAHEDDSDSDLGPKTRLKRDEVPDSSTKEESDLKDALDLINGIALTSDKDDIVNIDLVETLQKKFPKAVITIGKPGSAERDEDKIAGIENSDNIKNTNVESAESQKVMQAKVAPNSTAKRSASILQDVPTEPWRLDPIRHLSDLANYATDMPTDDEFGRIFPFSEIWSSLSYTRRLEIAHARAIKIRYGKPVEGGGCTCCKEQGLECRVYQTQLANLSHMNFGQSCQNCRLFQSTCDLPTAIAAAQQYTPVTPKLELRIDTRNTSTGPQSGKKDTPSAAATPKPSLISRMTIGNQTNPTSNSDTQDGKDSAIDDSHGSLVISKDQRRLIGALGDISILDVAAKIGLQLSGHVPRVITAMYRQWKDNKEVRPHFKKQLSIQHYYSNLVNLYILGYAKVELDLCYAVLLRFQTTNYQNATNTDLPDVGTVVRVFQYLPWDNPLCRWISILYAFLWGTEMAGDYGKFMHDNPGLDRSALMKLLYCVSHIRDPHVMGHDDAVLARWCEVHNHETGNVWEQGLCQDMQSAIKISTENSQEQETSRMVEEAYKIIDKFERVQTPASSFSKGKRKANGTPTHTHKKYKRGGYGGTW